MTERQCRTSGSVYLFFCSFLTILFVSLTGPADAAPPVVGDVALNQSRHVSLGIPIGNDRSTVVVSRAQYALGWDFVRRGPAWVGWELTKKQLGTVKRSNVFRIDHDLEEYLSKIKRGSVKPDEYKGSCLDRGHQVASADRTALLSDNQATFMMSNVVPQAAYMNRVTWASLEQFLRDIVLYQNKELSIYSGTVYGPSQGIGTSHDIQVPTKNFKLIVIKPAGVPAGLKNMRLLVVDVPNLTSKNSDPVRDYQQACEDSAHTARLDESNTKAYWRSYLSELNIVQGESRLGFSFLSSIPKLSKAELDALLQTQIKHRMAAYINLMNVMTNALQEASALEK